MEEMFFTNFLVTEHAVKRFLERVDTTITWDDAEDIIRQGIQNAAQPGAVKPRKNRDGSWYLPCRVNRHHFSLVLRYDGDPRVSTVIAHEQTRIDAFEELRGQIRKLEKENGRLKEMIDQGGRATFKQLEDLTTQLLEKDREIARIRQDKEQEVAQLEKALATLEKQRAKMQSNFQKQISGLMARIPDFETQVEALKAEGISLGYERNMRNEINQLRESLVAARKKNGELTAELNVANLQLKAGSYEKYCELREQVEQAKALTHALVDRLEEHPYTGVRVTFLQLCEIMDTLKPGWLVRKQRRDARRATNAHNAQESAEGYNDTSIAS